jgi:uncharacterized protein YqeY
MLKEKLEADLTAALKAHDAIRKQTLRMALSAVTNEEKAGKQERTLTDDEIIKVLTREAKKRREAAEAFESGGRAESAQAERDEGAILEEYLPAQLSDEELVAIVTAAVAESGAEGPRQMGAVMKIVNPKVAGKAEGGRVAAEVKKQLSS